MRFFSTVLAAFTTIYLDAATSTAAPTNSLDELRKTFTVDGNPVPPEIFADFGDSDLADSAPIVVTIDARAATGGNRYADPVRRQGRWIVQTKPNDKTLNGAKETAYEYVGRTRDNLLVTVASYSGGGSGTFYTLHISSTRPRRPRSTPTASPMSGSTSPSCAVSRSAIVGRES